jgi:hypothetical protein
MHRKIELSPHLIPSDDNQPLDVQSLVKELNEKLAGQFIMMSSTLYVKPETIYIADTFNLLFDGIKVTIPLATINHLGATIYRCCLATLTDAGNFVRMAVDGEIEIYDESDVLERLALARDSLNMVLDFGFKVLDIAENYD